MTCCPRLVKIFMRRDCSNGVGRQDVLDSGCHVADRGSSGAGAGKSSTLFLPWWGHAEMSEFFVHCGIKYSLDQASWLNSRIAA